VGHKNAVTGAFDSTTKSFCSSGDPRLPRSNAAGRGEHFSTLTARAGESQLALPKPEKTVSFSCNRPNI